MTANHYRPTRFPNYSVKAPTGAALIEQERVKATFNVKTLSKFIYGEEYLAKLDKIVPILENDPVFNKSRRYFQGRDEKIRDAWRKDRRFLELRK